MDSRILLCLSAWPLVLPCTAALHPQDNAGHLQRHAAPAVQQAAAPRAVRLGIISLDPEAARLRPLVADLAAAEGFEVLPEEISAHAEVQLVLRSSGSEKTAAVASRSAREAAREWQRRTPGGLAEVCDACFDSSPPVLYVDLGRAASAPPRMMDAALSVRDALATLASAGPRTAQKGAMVSPAPGSTLPGSAVTFQWTPGEGVQQFWLMIGLWPGGDTLYSADQGLLTSAPVSGLPVDGRTIYVRLWSLIDNQWVYNDYQYKAAGSVAPAKAQIIEPAPGATLAGSTATFRWNTGAAVVRYFLFVGLWQGGNTLFSQDMGASLEAVVTNLPVDGSTIHVRLWSFIDGSWQFNDYTFKAAGSVTPVKAALTAPSPGSVLPGATATFQWSAGQAVTRYFLFIGRWQGGNTILSQDMGTSLSATVSNLPADGSTLYVRLWSLIQGSWQFNDYVFTASGTQPAAQKGQLTSPAPGSTLSGPSVTFTWTPGSRVERFWLFVGTSLGNNNIYGADQATNTSVTVSNLPVNGQVVYVRLWSYIDGAWQFSDASYRAAGP
ncbi:MAG: hypothetical protein KatS3mg005_1956 [Bryobacteraceae bacterium]|nr:MAG: hypothetical protein KatS3mg005_1956 [Bryobacteraceae bacterium]